MDQASLRCGADDSASRRSGKLYLRTILAEKLPCPRDRRQALSAFPVTAPPFPARIRQITDHHNRTRAAVGVGPLGWSSALASYAQQWADHLAQTGCMLQHRQPNAYGENLFAGTFGHYHADDAAASWESEKSNYSGGVLTPSNWHSGGHYTQMVWRKTTAFGCGESVCGNMLIVACNYDPPGNYIGQAPY